jgi:hypothetical protein
MRFRLRTLLILLAILPPILAAVGVGFFGLKQKPPSVVGTVTYRGMPAAGVTVTFAPIATSEPRYTATTDAAGRYRLSDGKGGPPLQTGTYQATFTSPALPARYQSPNVSGITVDISGPKNQIDIDLY